MITGGSAPNIAFRVDSSLTIGSGHLRRCLVLAERLRSSGAHICFVCRAHPGNANHLVPAQGYELLELLASDAVLDAESGYASWLGVSQVEDAAATIAALAGRSLHSMIVDHYAIDADWHRVVRPIAPQIVAIDDLGNRDHDCDMLIDTAPGDAHRYDSLIPADAQRLLGPRYALLRPEFAAGTRSTRDRPGHVARILVAFGGVDADDATGAALDAIDRALPTATAVDVVLGSSAPHLERVVARCRDKDSWSLHVDTDEMAKLMDHADLAIGAAGVTSWERACLGLPSLVMVIADNQRLTAEGLAAAGCAIVVPTQPSAVLALAAALTLLSSNRGVLAQMSAAGRALVDGRGAGRVATAILPADLTVRTAVASDAAMLWQWRNDAAVRAVSLQSAPILLADHERWFGAKLADANTVILIGRIGGEDIGVVRFDIADGTARVSIQLAPGVAGGGRGGALLATGEAHLATVRPDARVMIAEVLDDNAASLALFRAGHYRIHVHQLRRVLKHDAL